MTDILSDQWLQLHCANVENDVDEEEHSTYFEIHLNASQELRAINTPVNGLSIFGDMRGGKSFLLNFLAGYDNNRFSVSPGRYTSHTRGIHIGPTFPFVGEGSPVRMVCFDIEGYGDMDGAYNATLLCPILPVSRCIIYNISASGFQLDEALSRLHSLVIAARRLDPNAARNRRFGKLFIVCRDWRDTKDARGNVETIEGFEKQFLGHVYFSMSKIVHRQNSQRAAIKEAFEEGIVVVGLPPPGPHELTDSADFTPAQASPEFVAAASDLRDRILAEMRTPWTFHDLPMTGTTVADAVEAVAANVSRGEQQLFPASLSAQIEDRILTQEKNAAVTSAAAIVNSYTQLMDPAVFRDILMQETSHLRDEFIVKTNYLRLPRVVRMSEALNAAIEGLINNKVNTNNSTVRMTLTALETTLRGRATNYPVPWVAKIVSDFSSVDKAQFTSEWEGLRAESIAFWMAGVAQANVSDSWGVSRSSLLIVKRDLKAAKDRVLTAYNDQERAILLHRSMVLDIIRGTNIPPSPYVNTPLSSIHADSHHAAFDNKRNVEMLRGQPLTLPYDQQIPEMRSHIGAFLTQNISSQFRSEVCKAIDEVNNNALLDGIMQEEFAPLGLTLRSVAVWVWNVIRSHAHYKQLLTVRLVEELANAKDLVTAPSCTAERYLNALRGVVDMGYQYITDSLIMQSFAQSMKERIEDMWHPTMEEKVREAEKLLNEFGVFEEAFRSAWLEKVRTRFTRTVGVRPPTPPPPPPAATSADAADTSTDVADASAGAAEVNIQDETVHFEEVASH